MQIKFTSNSKLFVSSLEELDNELRYFASIAINDTAFEIKNKEIALMRASFDRPTPWLLKSLVIDKANKANKNKLVAIIDKNQFTEPVEHILSPHMDAGQRGQNVTELRLKSKVVVGRDVKLNQYGNLAPSTYNKILSQLKLQRDPTSNATNSSRSKKNRKNSTYFLLSDKKGLGKRLGRKIVFERKGDSIIPTLIFIQRPSYQKIFPYVTTAQKIFDRIFTFNINIAISKALASSGFK